MFVQIVTNSIPQFCEFIGLPTKRGGYLPRTALTFGEARAGIDGGSRQTSS